MEPTSSAAGGQPSFGELLRSFREAAGLSQEELADAAKISVDAVSALERGTRTHPYPATVRALTDALHLREFERAALVSAVPRRSHARQRGTGTAVLRPAPLPAATTPLLGREKDVATVSDLLRSRSTRLVTLTGTGGVGKSRLAVAAAAEASSAMRDGVVFVALAPVRDQTLVLSQIGRALGVECAGGSDPQAAVVTALMPLQMVLVVDNAEHLSGVGRIVADLLSRCSGLSVLATSRAPLQIRGESEFQVRPLSLPPVDVRDPSVLLRSPAASLLIGRGRAVRRDLVVRTEDVPAIVAICHRLAGLPLALELAAAGLRTFDPQSLLRHLDDVVESPGVQDLPQRQNTLRSTLDWSCALLTEEDLTAFRALSTFIGGFTLDAAEAVIGPENAAGTVQRLVAHSLCTTTTAADGRLRYVMLEPVAQYGRSLLSQQDADVASRRHAEFFLSLAEQATSGYHGDHQVEWLGRLDEEAGNLSSAFEWVIGEGLGGMAGRFTWALWMYWWIRGRLPWARPLLDEALQLDMPDAARARVLIAAGGIAEPGTATDRVERRYEDALELARNSDDHDAQASAALALGGIALERGDWATAESRLRAALVAAERAAESGLWYAAHAHVLLGSARRARGDPAGAIRHIEAGLEPARRRGDGVAMCIALYNLAMAGIALGDQEPAREHLLEATRLCQRAGDAPNLSLVLDALAVAEAPTATPERIAALLGAAEGIRSRMGSTGYGFYRADADLRDRTAQTTRGVLGDHAYLRRFEVGRSMTLDEASDLAQGTVDDQRPGAGLSG